MEAWQERIIQERAQLDERLAKLNEFMGSEALLKLSSDEQQRLRYQHHYMTRYSDILAERVASWS